jgi:hypothetical protein
MKKLSVLVTLLLGLSVVTQAQKMNRPARVDPLFHEIWQAGATSRTWNLDSATVDTSVVYEINSGASITSTHKVVHSDDVMDYKVVMELAILPNLIGGRLGWVRMDSVTITDTLTTRREWGVKQGNYMRFIFDPVDADWVPADTLALWGHVMSDK